MWRGKRSNGLEGLRAREFQAGWWLDHFPTQKKTLKEAHVLVSVSALSFSSS